MSNNTAWKESKLILNNLPIATFACTLSINMEQGTDSAPNSST